MSDPSTVSISSCDIEVVTFIATDGAYYFVLGDRRRADIVKCRSFQPTIRDHGDYAAYLWIKAYQGYFVLRQRFLDHHAGEWRVIREVEVQNADPDFFDSFGDLLVEEFEAAEGGGD